MRTANSQGANSHGVNSQGANFQGANFQGAKGSRNTAQRIAVCVVAALAVLTLAGFAYADVEPLQSPRLERAKDLIADEQWERAIEQLKAAAADAKERNKDEALFWLAHSQHQAGESAAAVQTIARLERDFRGSRWVKPARSLRIEIAQKLQRNDVLWWTAVPPAPPAPPAATAPVPPAPPAAATPPPGPPAPTRPAQRVRTARGSARTTSSAPADGVPIAAPVMPAPPTIWIPDGWDPDTALRIQALGSLIHTDAPKVIPILKEIALESPDVNEASRAIFVLAQSGKPEAQSIVLEVAKLGSELVQVAAVRELGRFGGPKAADELLQVYSIGNARVKYQVVNSLGERAATTALVKIAETERDRKLQETAIVRLGQAGARDQLARLYAKVAVELKRPIVVGLFNARGEDELIRIAETERDEKIRAEAVARLRLLGTPKTRAWLERQKQNR